jgi:hypothetical protein
MAILVIFTGLGVNKNQYEAARKEVDWEHRQPAGLVFAAAGFDQTGMRVVDIWESQQALDDFLNKRLMPAIKKLGIPAPDVEVYPLHNATAYSGVDQFKVKQSVR